MKNEQAENKHEISCDDLGQVAGGNTQENDMYDPAICGNLRSYNVAADQRCRWNNCCHFKVSKPKPWIMQFKCEKGCYDDQVSV